MDLENVMSADDKKHQISSVFSLLDQVQVEPTLRRDTSSSTDNSRSSNAVTQSQPVYRLYRRRFAGVVGLVKFRTILHPAI
jgi:hypothetical protein